MAFPSKHVLQAQISKLRLSKACQTWTLEHIKTLTWKQPENGAERWRRSPNLEITNFQVLKKTGKFGPVRFCWTPRSITTHWNLFWRSVHPGSFQSSLKPQIVEGWFVVYLVRLLVICRVSKFFLITYGDLFAPTERKPCFTLYL